MLSIMSNPTALAAGYGLNAIDKGLSKTMRALSTGLRINSAADDASGLAVSEKLRAQISGLEKAATNAQDAISILSTADGALSSMGSMLSRIRELAVQAGDPAYTVNDRNMLQLEVDQLKTEINRVSANTEFNTKKLLNGEATAIWSASSDEIEAIVKGPVAEGNYKISYDIEPGQNAIYKSNIITQIVDRPTFAFVAYNESIIKEFNAIEGLMPAEQVNVYVHGDDEYFASAYVAGATGGFKTLTDNMIDAVDGISGAYIGKQNMQAWGLNETGEVDTGIGIAVEMEVDGSNIVDSDFLRNITRAHNDGEDINITADVYFRYNNSIYKINAGTIAAADTEFNATKLSGAGAGTLKFERRGTAGVDATFTYHIENETEGTTANLEAHSATAVQINYRVMLTETGALSDWNTLTFMPDGSIANADNIRVNVGGKAVAPFAGTVAWVDDPIVNTKANSFMSLSTGDRMLWNMGSFRTNNTPPNVAGVVRIGDTGSSLFMAHNAANPDYEVKHTMYTAEMNDLGEMYYGKVEFTFNKATTIAPKGQAGEPDDVYLKIYGENAGNPPEWWSRIDETNLIYNADGVNIFEHPQELEISAGNGKSVKVVLNGLDTFQTIEKKLNDALVEIGGLDGTREENKYINENLVKFVHMGDEKLGDRAVTGTFVIQSALLGSDSELNFRGSQDLLNALGFTQIQEARNADVTARVTDAHTGAFIGEDTVSDNMLRNVIKGVDVKFDTEKAITAHFDKDKAKIIYTQNEKSREVFLHIKNNAMMAAVGANEGITLDVSIPRVDTTSLEINDVRVNTFEASQKAITKIDMALERLAQMRDIIGDSLTALDHSLENLSITTENMVASESRVRDLDIARASTDIARMQVLEQAAAAMLAQANQIPSYALKLLQ